MLRRNRNHDSCEKNITGMENTGILRIPAGIGNLGLKRNCWECWIKEEEATPAVNFVLRWR
jgi:hypothetical protein